MFNLLKVLTWLYTCCKMLQHMETVVTQQSNTRTSKAKTEAEFSYLLNSSTGEVSKTCKNPTGVIAPVALKAQNGNYNFNF